MQSSYSHTHISSAPDQPASVLHQPRDHTCLSTPVLIQAGSNKERETIKTQPQHQSPCRALTSCHLSPGLDSNLGAVPGHFHTPGALPTHLLSHSCDFAPSGSLTNNHSLYSLGLLGPVFHSSQPPAFNKYQWNSQHLAPFSLGVRHIGQILHEILRLLPEQEQRLIYGNSWRQILHHSCAPKSDLCCILSEQEEKCYSHSHTGLFAFGGNMTASMQDQSALNGVQVLEYHTWTLCHCKR